jgi:hypothetical protein
LNHAVIWQMSKKITAADQFLLRAELLHALD